jgi:YebC/PmpR family DNA-binding regulatory protein
MAGHSKFANIKHRKGAQDAKRGKIFAKIGREITVAVKEGGNGDPAMNPRLRGAIINAKSANMPNSRIDSAIKSGLPGQGGADYKEMRYDGYGTAGVAIIVTALTDNKNRTASDVRSTFTKYGGSMGETGSLDFSFDKMGVIVYPEAVASADDVFEVALEAGASDVISEDGTHEIRTAIEDFASARDALAEKYGDAQESELAYIPNTMTELTESQASSIMKLVDILEDNDDVQKVFTNADISDEIAAKLAE